MGFHFNYVFKFVPFYTFSFHESLISWLFSLHRYFKLLRVKHYEFGLKIKGATAECKSLYTRT